MKTKYTIGKTYQIEKGITGECTHVTKRYVYFKSQQLHDAMFEECTLKGYEGTFPFLNAHQFSEITP